MQRILSLIACLLLFIGLNVSGQQAAIPEDRPNILLIMVDDLGPEWIGCYGADNIETPNIDRLAETGMRFENVYSMPKCTPTRATLLTGQYPFRHGWVNHWAVPRWGAGCHFDWRHNTTFARVLRDAGYATAIAGKWQINDFRVQPDALRQHGFDEWCMWTGFESRNPPSAERYWDPYVFTADSSQTHKGDFGPDVYTDFLIDFMKRHQEKPMLLYYPMVLTHTPFVTTPHQPDASTKLEKHKAMVAYTDHLVGRLMKGLDELDLRENTIVIFTTDNGTSSGITGHINGRAVQGGKGGLGENGAWAPFIVNGPGIVPQGVVTDCLSDFSDLFPTMLDLAGVPLPDALQVDGRSIAPVILGKSQNGPREWIMAMGGGTARATADGVVSDVPYAARILRGKRFKIQVNQQGKTVKVFDLKMDPGEMDNLIDSEAQTVLAARRKLEVVVQSFPKQDASPRYEPTPAQPWDKLPAESN